MHQILNSTIFRDAIMKMDKWGEISEFRLLPNAEIYKMIMDGAETLSPEKDNVIDIYVDDYFSRKGVIGYTYPNTKWIYANTRFYDVNHTRDIGSNFIHEYGHKIGFDHDFKATTRRPHSICYLLNGIYEETYNKLFGITSTKVYRCYRSWRSLWFKKVCYWETIYA